jgi:hypothetical protein
MRAEGASTLAPILQQLTAPQCLDLDEMTLHGGGGHDGGGDDGGDDPVGQDGLLD